MKRYRLPYAMILVPCCVLIGCGTPPTASVPLERAEGRIEEDALPSAARDALRARAGGRGFTGVEREDRVLYAAFEAEWMDGPVEAEATVLADGAVLEEERELEEADFVSLPRSVRVRIDALREQGFEVAVARRAIYLFDVDASRRDDDGGVEERELLLRPDGSDATALPR